jgi:hypothetical protein
MVRLLPIVLAAVLLAGCQSATNESRPENVLKPGAIGCQNRWALGRLYDATMPDDERKELFNKRGFSIDELPFDLVSESELGAEVRVEIDGHVERLWTLKSFVDTPQNGPGVKTASCLINGEKRTHICP